jgi:hypothetical protein
MSRRAQGTRGVLAYLLAYAFFEFCEKTWSISNRTP